MDFIIFDFFKFEFLTNTFLSVQQIDAVASSHEIATDVNNPDEINEIFDDITYSKGGSVIRMANYFIGNQTFYKGITVSILI
jgi:aminopeptidase N